jgi:negative regulator of sigma E activity
MNMREFDEQLSAYLDGKLSATEGEKLEQELRQNPELKAALERLKKLEGIVRQSQIVMPAEGYFDNFAERIDAKLAREARPKRGFALLQPILPKSRVIAILSSVAAIFLIVVVVNQVYKPASEQYTIPKSVIVNPPAKPEVRSEPETAMRPAIATQRLKDSEIKRKDEAPDSAIGKVIESDRIPEGVKDDEYKEPPVFPKHEEVVQTLSVPVETKPTLAQPVDTVRNLLPSRITREKSDVTVTESIGAAKPVFSPNEVPFSAKPAQLTESANKIDRKAISLSSSESEASPPPRITPPSIPLAIDSLQAEFPQEALSKGKFTETFNPTQFEQRVQALLDSGKYVPVLFVAWDKESYGAATSSFDAENASDQSWYDSLRVMGMEQWQAENAYREAMRSGGNRLAGIITARLYIEHYLSSGDAHDTGLWRDRLNEVRQWEQGLRK